MRWTTQKAMRKTQCAACDCAARCDGHCSALQWLMHRTAASCPAYIRMTRNAESRLPHHAPAGEAGPYSSPHNAVSISTRAAWEYPTGPLTRCPTCLTNRHQNNEVSQQTPPGGCPTPIGHGTPPCSFTHACRRNASRSTAASCLLLPASGLRARFALSATAQRQARGALQQPGGSG